MRILIGVIVLLSGAAARADEAPAFVREAIERSLGAVHAEIIVESYVPTIAPGCTPSMATAIAPPSVGGQVTLRLAGETELKAPCDGWARVKASVVVRVLVTTKAIASGTPLADVVVPAERALGGMRHPVAELPPGALSTQSLAAGAVIESRYVRLPGPGVGDPVTVVIQSGSISATELGRRCSCDADHECATLPSGREVRGHLVGDELLVEAE